MQLESTQEYWVYFKEIPGGRAENHPAIIYSGFIQRLPKS